MNDYIQTLREKIGHETILTPGAAAIVVNNKGEILLQARPGENTWGCPGGHMNVGETVIENVVREVNEETGLHIKNPTLFGIYSGPRYSGTYPNGDKVQSVIVVFLVDDYVGELQADRESDVLAFFQISQLPAPLGKHHAEYISDYVEYTKGNREIPIIR